MKHSETKLKYPISKFDGTAAWFWKYSSIQNPANSPYEAQCWAPPTIHYPSIPRKGFGTCISRKFPNARAVLPLPCHCENCYLRSPQRWDKRETEHPSWCRKRNSRPSLSLPVRDTSHYRLAHGWMKVSEKCLHLQRSWLPCTLTSF